MPFAAALGAHGTSRLFVGGLATDYCIKATVLDGLKEGFEVVVLEDGIAAVDATPGDGARALAAMKEAGAHLARLEDLGD
jgi:nicotinamidase/pyrazinamidase